jgi:uncharacterized protein with ATP-grasp and redox domains
VFKALSDCAADLTPVELAYIVYKEIERFTGIEDPYEKEKEQSNKVALQLLSQLKETIRFCEHPLSFYALMAVLANQIDLGAFQVDLTQLSHRFIDTLKHNRFRMDRFAEFEKKLQTSKTLLYILDNAGEIVFDLFFMQRIKDEYPQIEICAAYRSEPMINDVIEKDLDSIDSALKEGIDLFDSGSPYPGILFPKVFELFKNRFEKSDLILSKGQGNLEGLFDRRKPSLYFGLMVKCRSISNLLGVPISSLLFTDFSGEAPSMF